MLCFATTDIAKGDMIGFDYSEGFLQSMSSREEPIAYFSKKGETLAEVKLSYGRIR